MNRNKNYIKQSNLQASSPVRDDALKLILINASSSARDDAGTKELLTANGSSLFLISSNSDSLHVYRLNQPRQKIISINPDDRYAIITDRRGMKCRREFYYGNTYLSQSTRRLTVAPNIQLIVIYNAAGNKRTLNF